MGEFNPPILILEFGERGIHIDLSKRVEDVIERKTQHGIFSFKIGGPALRVADETGLFSAYQGFLKPVVIYRACLFEQALSNALADKPAL